MDWTKVIANLRAQTDFYTKQVHHWETMSGYHERAKEYRESANIASILASALRAGMEDDPSTK